MNKTGLKNEFFRLARYGIVGLSSNAIVYLIFLAIYYAGIAPLAATAICYLIGLTISYVANRSWTFSSSSDHRRDLPRFLTAYGVGLVAALGMMWLFLHWVSPEIAQLMVIFGSAAVIYVMLRLTGFGQAAPRAKA